MTNRAATVKITRAAILAQPLETDAPVRQHLVDKLRFLIDTGRYDVSNVDIAQAMMDEGVVDRVVLDDRDEPPPG